MIPVREVYVVDLGKAERYAKLAGESFPPITLRVDGSIADGNHRMRAAFMRGDSVILARVPRRSRYLAADAAQTGFSNIPSA